MKIESNLSLERSKWIMEQICKIGTTGRPFGRTDDIWTKGRRQDDGTSIPTRKV